MSTQRVYTGYSGQLAVMAELIFRQVNVALPQVDLGTDLFAFQDATEGLCRLQVKTAQGTRYVREEGYSAQFGFPMRQLERASGPALSYVLVVRFEGRFVEFVVLARTAVVNWWNGDRRFGTENPASGDLVVTVQFRPDSVTCGEIDLTPFRNTWSLPGLELRSSSTPGPQPDQA